MVSVIVILRLIHIVVGAFWVGGATLTAFFLLPTVRATGPLGGQFAGQLLRRTRLPDWLTGAGLVTVLSGLILYGKLYSDTTWDGINSGVVFAIGGLVAIIVIVIGFTVSLPTANKMGRIGAAIQSQGSPPTPAQAAEQGQLLDRMIKVTILNSVLLLFTAACMATARYM